MGKLVRRASGEATWMRSPLYEEIAKVPLIVHVPGAKPRRTSELACALDIAPTLLDMVGLKPGRGRQWSVAVAGGYGRAFRGL